jgi:hypothetical protein
MVCIDMFAPLPRESGNDKEIWMAESESDWKSNALAKFRICPNEFWTSSCCKQLLSEMVSLAVWHWQVRAKQEASASGGCSFANCLHVGEPYCAVGNDWDRYPHYLGLLEEVRKREEVEKRVLGTKRESDIRCNSFWWEGVKTWAFMTQSTVNPFRTRASHLYMG